MNGYGLIRKQLGRKSGRRSYRRRRQSRKLALYRAPKAFFGGKVFNHAIEISVPVYIRAAAGPIFQYSLSTSNELYWTNFFNTGTPNYAPDITNMFNAYLYYKIRGVKMEFTRSINAALTTVYQLPALWADISGTFAPVQVNMFTNRTVCESDTAMEVQVLNTSSRPPSKYYSFGGNAYSGPSGTVDFGNAWMSTDRQPSINLMIGFLDGPTLAGTTESPKIGSLNCTVYLSFCKRIKLNNY